MIIVHEFVRFLVGLLAPFVFVFGGAGLVGIGLEYDINILVWAGGIATICGLLCGCWMFFLDGAASCWD